MPTSPNLRVVAALLFVTAVASALVVAVGRVSSGRAASPQRTAAVVQAPATAVPQLSTRVAAPHRRARTAAVDRLTTIAKRRYAEEVHGGVAIGTLHRVGRDPMLRRTLAAGDLTAARSYVRGRFSSVWYHWHVSRMRIMKGSQVAIDAGVPFVVAPSQMTLRSAGGRSIGTLEVSIQDVIGFVRYMHRNYPVDVVVRGRGPAHVRTSLPAAATATLPSRGTVSIGGRRYAVRSFHQRALGGEPVTVWILAKG
jgi:hypothetical protein